ncbi:hypothetical protein [Wolbachia endosymbiont (group B) of Hofmannophila pseudospretella]|uniref:hypothetical protein n=1 Tax=Wolbachia endosymbiont (group B) of Hofmannophila pseudospretella TaxID=3066177 RepID=UPI00333EB2D4
MTTTIRDAADDAGFITALMALQEFNDKVYIKAASADEVYTKTAADTAFVKTIDLATKVAEEVVKQPVVDVLVPALATVGTDDTKKVYTKGTVDTSFVKTADLATKVAEEVVKQPVVDVLVPALATVGTDDTKKVYTKGTVDTSFVKIDASNLTDAANQKAFAEVILPAKDGKQSILVNKLGEALDRVQDNADDKVYGAQGSEKIAKDFLADKGLKPTPTDVANELVKNQSFQASTKIAVNAQDAGFQEAVKAVMSQPSFEIPIDPSAPLSWDW